MGAFEVNTKLSTKPSASPNTKRRVLPSSAERLIAVVADAGSEEVVRNLLLDQGIANAHVARGTIDDAIELMRTVDHSPRHLLVDVSGSSMPVSDLMRLAEVVDPRAQRRRPLPQPAAHGCAGLSRQAAHR